MSHVVGTGKGLRLTGFLWNVWRQYGLVDCAATVRRKWQFHRLNRAQPSGRMVLRPGLTFQVLPQAAPAFRYFADMDPSMWREMDAFLALTESRRRLLDVGAHYGVFSLAFTCRGGESLALEPSNPAFQVLIQHADLNPSFKLRPRQTAVSDQPGNLLMHFEGSHLVAGKDSADNEAVEVPVSTIDDLVAAEAYVPDAVKIDVEGYEVNVLIGAKRLLSRHDPILFLEVHPDLIRSQGRSVEELIRLMSELHYGFSDSHGAPIKDVHAYFAGPIRRVVCRKAV